MGRVRRLLTLLVVVMVLGASGCSHATSPNEAQQFTQGGGSMEPTVKAGQVISARPVGSDYVPQRGDIVLFHPSGEQWGDSKSPFLKRVIAVAGETIACCDKEGRVTIDGAPLDEPYVATNSPLDQLPNPRSCLSRRFEPVTVAKSTIFVMGDNRMASNDSRCLGPIPVTSVFAVMIS
jgi:signal peptidase I